MAIDYIITSALNLSQDQVQSLSVKFQHKRNTLLR